MPAITLSTSSFFPDTERAFRAAAELGYDGVEVMVNHDRRSQSVVSIDELSRKYRTPVLSIHVPCLVITQHVWGWNPELKLRRSMEMANAVGASMVVVHPPFRWQKEYARRFVDLVHELHHTGGADLSVENMYSVEAFGRFVNPYNCTEDPALGEFPALTLDTSHAAADRRDPLELFKQMDGRVRHMHLSDSRGSGGDEHLPPGMGALELEKLAAAMIDDGYDGQIVLEIALQRLPEPRRFLVAAESRQWTADAFSTSPEVRTS